MRLFVLSRFDSLKSGPVSAYVVPSLPLNVDLVLGLDVISQLGITVDKEGVRFGLGLSASAVATDECRIEDRDFSAWFSSGVWTVRWNWREHESGGVKPRVANNYVLPCDTDAVTSEIESWLDSGILVKYNPSVHGRIRRFLPVLAVRQKKGEVMKVRPVFDYRSMNESLESHPGGATPVCADRLRTWRQIEGGGALIDLKAAYLQVRVAPDV